MALDGGNEHIGVEFLENLVHGQVDGIRRMMFRTVSHQKHSILSLPASGRFLTMALAL